MDNVFGFAGYSGVGKTTLIEQLLPRFVLHGLKVALIKHAHHNFDIDKPGKDSFRHREAGATEVLVTSDKRWVLMHELRDEPEPNLEEQLKLFSPHDLILVEGYKKAAIPKLELHRPSIGRPILHTEDPHIVAIATDAPLTTHLPQLDINNPEQIAQFVIAHMGLSDRKPGRKAA
jgi:molybdopterin-guanine dinucleotide biosynthesis adapter protein